MDLLLSCTSWICIRTERPTIHLVGMLAADNFELSVISGNYPTLKVLPGPWSDTVCRGSQHLMTSVCMCRAPLPHYNAGLPPVNNWASVHFKHWLKPLWSLHHNPPSALPSPSFFSSIPKEQNPRTAPETTCLWICNSSLFPNKTTCIIKVESKERTWSRWPSKRKVRAWWFLIFLGDKRTYLTKNQSLQ